MMEFTKNNWGQRDIINKIVVLTKQDTYTIHAFIPKKYWKYSSTAILKHVDVLDKVNKSPYGSLPYITPHNAYNITINVRTVTLEDISQKPKE